MAFLLRIMPRQACQVLVYYTYSQDLATCMHSFKLYSVNGVVSEHETGRGGSVHRGMLLIAEPCKAFRVIC